MSLGIAAAAGDAVSTMAARTVRVARASPVTTAAEGAVRVVAATPLGVRVGAALTTIEDRGRNEAVARVAQTQALVEATMGAVATSDAVVRVVNDVVDRVLWPIVDEVLPVVLDRLAAEPEQVRALVLGQSTGIVDDLTGAARARAAQADDRVGSLVDRLLRRGGRAEMPAVAPTPALGP